MGNVLEGFWKGVKFSVGPICLLLLYIHYQTYYFITEWNRRTTEEKQGGKMKLGFSLPLYSLPDLADFLRREAPVSQEWESILSTEVSRNNAKLYSHKQNKKIHSPCCAGTCTAILSRRETIAYNLPTQYEFQTATWERSLCCQL